MRPRLMHYAAFSAMCAAYTGLLGCTFPHKGIVYSDSADWHVTNGVAYDVSLLKMAGVNQLVVPASAQLESGPAGTDCVIRMRKSQGFMGHPVERVSIVDTRKEMGCAVLRRDEAILVGTFGEWDSNIEGGSSLKTTIVVPDGIEVTTQEDLSGPQSIARDGIEDGSWEKLPFTPADKATMVKMQNRDD